MSLSPQLLSTVVMAPESLSISGLWATSLICPIIFEYWLLLAGILGQGVAAAGDRRAGTDGDLLHFGPLRSVTLGQRVFTACWWASPSVSSKK